MMTELYKRVSESDRITENIKYYWGYMYGLGNEVVVPYLKDSGFYCTGNSVAEIGSAEGGVLAAFVEAGAKDALGTDIVQERLDSGNLINEIAGIDIEFSNHNILGDSIPDEWKEKYDLVILRDVIEHLEDTDYSLGAIRRLIKPGGYLFVTFPPYYSPFGAHQHTLNNFWGKFPFIHWLPDPIFRQMIKSGRKHDIKEVESLMKIKLSINKFLHAAENNNYSIAMKDFYILRPVYKMKFGLPTLKLPFFLNLPHINNLFTLEASYVLRKEK
jgi:SAM-dependent methyltransferase